jgi:hypothetical protein
MPQREEEGNKYEKEERMNVVSQGDNSISGNNSSEGIIHSIPVQYEFIEEREQG